MVNIKQIKYFVSVADQGSFSSAAREQYISVQAISKAMADLEKGLPAPLFVKTHRGVTLTPFGESFLIKARGVCISFDELESMAHPSASDSQLSLFLCAPTFFRNNKARADMADFILKQLGIETKVAIGTGDQGMELLLSGECDALITIGSLDRDGFDCVPLGTVPTGICMAKDHPLASKESVSIADTEPYLMYSSIRFDHFNESILVMYQKAGHTFNVVEPKPFNPLKLFQLFFKQQCLAFSANIAPLGDLLPGTVMVPIAPEDALPVPVCFVTQADKKTTAYLRVQHLLKPPR